MLFMLSHKNILKKIQTWETLFMICKLLTIYRALFPTWVVLSPSASNNFLNIASFVVSFKNSI